MGKMSGFFEKLKSIKHIEIIACGAVLMVVLFAYFAFASCSQKQPERSVSGDTIISAKDDYCTSMQKQVERIVSEISGVGSASVVINWDKSIQTSLGGGVSENPKPIGALIVCDGGNNTKVKLDVIYAVSTLLDLSIEKIMVYPKSH